MARMTMLSARDLTKRYGDVHALKGLNLEVAAGEVVCLLGANGAGKTTTISLFLGFSRPTSGIASVNGIDVAHHPAKARAHLAYVPESVMLYRHLTGAENLAFFMQLAGHPKPSRALLLESLESAGLSRAAAERRSSEYSKGMRQKVGVAIALARNAKALLLDEPLSGLDPVAASELTQVVRSLGDRGMAVLMVTHDIFRAKDAAHRIGIMRDGELVRTVDAREVAHDALEKLYLVTMGAAA